MTSSRATKAETNRRGERIKVTKRLHGQGLEEKICFLHIVYLLSMLVHLRREKKFGDTYH